MAKARELSDEEQDALAAMLLNLIDAEAAGEYQPTAEESRAIEEAQQAVRRGEVVSQQEVEARLAKRMSG